MVFLPVIESSLALLLTTVNANKIEYAGFALKQVQAAGCQAGHKHSHRVHCLFDHAGFAAAAQIVVQITSDF